MRQYRTFSTLFASFFVVTNFRVIVNPFGQELNFCKRARVTPKETLFHCITSNEVSSKYSISFLIEVSTPLVIQGFPASFRRLRLIRSSGACLSIVFEIIFTNWSDITKNIAV